jgi:ergothioneine biosynthesis protein EgtB
MRTALRELYDRVRAQTSALARPLSPEDMVLQSMPDASPTKWHLAHTTWFFETFVLEGAPYRPEYPFLFNSYYDGVGERHPRDRRGMLSRPSVAEILEYRASIDARMREALATMSEEKAQRTVLGLHHEMQHQELLLTDIKHALSMNSTHPVYEARAAQPCLPSPLVYVRHEGGLVEIGAGNEGFAFDNERPRHRVWLEPHSIANRLVTCGEYAEFIKDGGYTRPELWLSEGFRHVSEHGVTRPMHWLDGDRISETQSFTLGGTRALHPDEPVCHVSYFEADAYARWSKARLPTEAEWENAAPKTPAGNFLEGSSLHPRGGSDFFGDVWVWTASAYSPYPGFAPLAGALGEYNGKFMVSQMVLRGGSCFSSRAHIRASYRNFFPPDARWQMTGIRLAR